MSAAAKWLKAWLAPMMMAKSVLWIIYGAVFLSLVTTYLQQDDRPLPAMKAAVTLPAGHLLSTGDVRLPGGPHYLRRGVAAGRAIEPDNLAPLPAVATPPNTVPVILTIDGASPSVPEVGARMWICPASSPDEKPVSVVSVMCAEGAGTCLAVVAVPGDHAASVAKLARRALSASTCPKEG